MVGPLQSDQKVSFAAGGWPSPDQIVCQEATSHILNAADSSLLGLNELVGPVQMPVYFDLDGLELVDSTGAKITDQLVHQEAASHVLGGVGNSQRFSLNELVGACVCPSYL
jgi:hypothetical protein